MPGKIGAKAIKLPMYFRKKPKGKTASGHKLGRYWHKKGVT